ncbi:MAG TPA: TlpA disulfide reductase family protein [Bryobacteraceae bacterium]|jgi:thiol-disulfide isomerase/thioredoxin|nr:TlpA disulfide reductase family protein [Bryobacteraceae bacterium]
MRIVLAISFAAGFLAAQPKLTPVNETSFAKMVATHKGKIVLVDFWATWCVPCRAEMPQLVKLADRLRTRGVDFVTVSADAPEQEQAAFKVLMQDSVAAPFYLKKVADDDKFYDSVDSKWSGEMPAMFIYDRSGKRVRSFLGETPMKDIEAAIQKLL